MTMILKLYMFLKERKRTIENAIVSLAFVVVAYLIHAFVVSLLTPKVPEILQALRLDDRECFLLSS